MLEIVLNRRMLLLVGALICGIAWTSKATAATRAPDPGFIHGFTEVTSDRPGYRKYVGTTNKCKITGTLLGIYDDENVPPGAVGGIAIGHTMFFRARDFVFAFSKKKERSAFYAPKGMKLPDELLK